MTYSQKLTDTKRLYPFTNWREAYDDGLEQYTAENCDRAKEVFDILIDQLIILGDSAAEPEKIKCFKKAITALMTLTKKLTGLLKPSKGKIMRID